MFKSCCNYSWFKNPASVCVLFRGRGAHPVIIHLIFTHPLNFKRHIDIRAPKA